MDQIHTLSLIQSFEPWRAFWRGEQQSLLICPGGEVLSELPRDIGVLSGSFNPLHDGHRKLAEAASQILGRSVLFELSVTNVDKSTIDEAEVLRRIRQFVGYKSLAITRAATFEAKAMLFVGCVFVVGYDTAERILSPLYYTDESAMQAALQAVGASGSRFLVACRLQDGELKCLEDLDVPTNLMPLFSAIPANMFRFDISSTTLRQKQ